MPHALAGMLAAAIGGRRGAALALASLVSYELDFTGRSQWLRTALPKRDGFNVTARIPAAGEARRTVVLVAHHDAAHTGWAWDPRLSAPARRRAAATGSTLPFSVPAYLATVLAASCSAPARAAGAAVFAALGTVALQSALAPVVPGASDNASGVAAVLSLAARFAVDPLPETDVVTVAPGCEEAGMGGMRAWLRGAGRGLDRETTLVLGLDTVGAGEPVVAVREGVTGRYRERDLAWADRGACRAGVDRPRRFGLGGWTDPLLAVHAGLPAISILSVRDGGFPNYHLPSDTPDQVDHGCVARCVRLAAGIAEEWAGA